jgi:hypothetical protein
MTIEILSAGITFLAVFGAGLFVGWSLRDCT